MRVGNISKYVAYDAARLKHILKQIIINELNLLLPSPIVTRSKTVLMFIVTTGRSNNRFIPMKSKNPILANSFGGGEHIFVATKANNIFKTIKWNIDHQ